MLAGEVYDPQDPGLVTDRRHCQELLRNYNARPEQELKFSGLDRLFASVGEDTVLMSPFLCDYGFNISIGAGTFINYGAIILDCATVAIGDAVQIGTGVQLVTAEHPLNPAERRTGVETAKPITIEDGAWIGSGVIVCPGVTIGRDSVIGAGSVVTKDIEPGVLAYGNPCRVARPLP